jgi:hypothetical protein|tara:strand:+ start:517 stop:1896 length:1380 start_codon:yes stop_codon:yes gene_type:complete
MPKAKDKGFVDLHSIHSKLADGYKIYENDIDDESDNIRDFKSVSESIEKLELIVDDGKELADKDINYKEYLNLVKRNIEKQKFQLFRLKLTTSHSTIINHLSKLDDASSSNDFIQLERYIKRFDMRLKDLTIESKISANHRELWNEYKKNIKWYYQELQIKKIQKSVNANKGRINTTISELDNAISIANDSLGDNDVLMSEKLVEKLIFVISQSEVTAQRDAQFNEFISKKQKEVDDYHQKIDDIKLKIEINRHKKIIEENKPFVLQGMSEIQANTNKEFQINLENEYELSVDDIEEKSIGKGFSVSKTIAEVIFYTTLTISAIYYTSTNYINLRELTLKLPDKEESMRLLKGNAYGEQIENALNYDKFYADKGIEVIKTLSRITPVSISINEIDFNQEESGPFIMRLNGYVNTVGSSGRLILNNYLKRLSGERIIEEVVLVNQRVANNTIIFNIDIIL